MSTKKITVHTIFNPPPKVDYKQESPNLMKTDGAEFTSIEYLLDIYSKTGHMPSTFKQAQYGEMPNDLNTVISDYKQLEHDLALKGLTIDDWLQGMGDIPSQPEKGVTAQSELNKAHSSSTVSEKTVAQEKGPEKAAIQPAT